MLTLALSLTRQTGRQGRGEDDSGRVALPRTLTLALTLTLTLTLLTLTLTLMTQAEWHKAMALQRLTPQQREVRCPKGRAQA